MRHIWVGCFSVFKERSHEFPLWLSGLRTQIASMRMQVQSLTLLSGLRIQYCHKLRRCSLDLALLWLWCRVSAAAPIQPLARELPYAAGAALKSKQTNKAEVTHTPSPQKVKVMINSSFLSYRMPSTTPNTVCTLTHLSLRAIYEVSIILVTPGELYNMETLSRMSKVTQLVNGQARIWIQSV